MQLRPYQEQLQDDIFAAWRSGAKNVMPVMPTGSGKTAVFAWIAAGFGAPVCLIAHRQELVSQISMALAKYGVRHRIVGPRNIIKLCVSLHMMAFGRSYYDPSSPIGVAGVDTLLKRKGSSDPWLKSIRLWVIDEGHHILDGNKWGKAVNLFDDKCLGLAPTATPRRADKKGLGRHADGLIDSLVEGPTTGQLIAWGYLTDYIVYAPPSDLDLSDVSISVATGDYNKDKVKKAVRRSHIIGDIVEHFQRIGTGKRGITFATDVETATDISRQFQAAGVKAETVSAKTPDRIRVDLLNKFARDEIQQLTNVDLFGEGFDVPDLDVVALGRPTQSLSLFMQQCGRVLRPVYAEGMPLNTVEQRKAAIAAGPKPKAYILDHVDNLQGRHGPPDAPRIWSLDRGETRRKKIQGEDIIPTRGCPECTALYKRTLKACPYCGYAPEPSSRSAPSFVDGDLEELDADVLAGMREEVDRIDGPPQVPQHLDSLAQAGAKKQHRKRQEVQTQLREAIAWWAGYYKALGCDDSTRYKLFYWEFGIDVVSACALGKRDAEALRAKVEASIEVMKADVPAWVEQLRTAS